MDESIKDKPPVLTITKAGSIKEGKERICREIKELLERTMNVPQLEAIVIYAYGGEHVMYRQIGTPAMVFQLANMGHDFSMQQFKLATEGEPAPDKKALN